MRWKDEGTEQSDGAFYRLGKKRRKITTRMKERSNMNYWEL